ncbi:MAG TPA: sn-glycerol-3-phosphate ABC transporter ATP-binding protein UgpC [Candidatus Limnocylindria bacterium]|nr:sn-glycerol-3-phosphate ABC transporter ATP-binding protein UgpC [Candidatus Limnocylindria bacterium]
MPHVELVNVSKLYGRTQKAVDRVSLRIEDGEFLVLVGPSGCGKSTVLRMVAGLEDISEGEVRIGSRVVNDVAPKDRDVAMVFQNYALYPHMSVSDNMAFGLRRRKMAEPEVARRVGGVAEMLGLTGYLTRRPRELSGGERQRVALGRAMVRDPQVFLFDEPLSNLDAKLRVQMRAEIKRLHQRVRATMIYVTHDQVEAMTLGDRIAVLQRGVLQQVADPFQLYSRPANQFVAGFIGSPPINFFAATVSGPGQAPTLSGSDGVSIPLSPELGARLEPVLGRPVTVGIRPEDLTLQPSRPGGAIRARVDVREPLGNEVLVHWTTPLGTLLSRVPGQHTPAEGESATLHFAFEKLHFFDPGSEKALDGALAAVETK